MWCAGSARLFWNSGVMAACSGLANLPDTASHYGSEAYTFLAQQLEAKPEPEKPAENADDSETVKVETEAEKSDEKCEKEPAAPPAEGANSS